MLIVLSLYFRFRSKANCFDGVKNQNEEAVDCGGVCAKKCDIVTAQDLIVEKTGAVPSGIAGKYDFYAEIVNPNAIFGSKNFDYDLNFKDASGAVIASRSGFGFILPGERKYAVESNIDSSSVPVAFDFKITNSNWVEFNDYYEKPNLQIVNKNYSQISGGIGFSEASGLLKNQSPYDFDLIRIEVILKNSAGEILALNSTQMKTVLSGENRDFKVSWPNSFPGTVENMEVQAEINIFNSDTFLKKFYKTEKFQQY
ncbi:MAG: hypothetical protein PHU23_10575 [Dehalococcoidales bacterium]|nr:hypothetical protein [Dehalococcoidales bacterium]